MDDDETRNTMDIWPWLTLAINVFTRMIVGSTYRWISHRISLGLCMPNADYDEGMVDYGVPQT